MSSTRRSSGADRGAPSRRGGTGGPSPQRSGPPAPSRRTALCSAAFTWTARASIASQCPAPRRQPFAYLWPFEEAAKATLCMRGIPEIGGSTPTTWRTSSAGRRTGGQYGSRGHPKAVVRLVSAAAARPRRAPTSTTTPGSRWTSCRPTRMRVGLMRGRGRPRTGARPVRAGRGGWCRDPRPRRRLLGRRDLEPRPRSGGNGPAWSRWRSTSTPQPRETFPDSESSRPPPERATSTRL